MPRAIAFCRNAGTVRLNCFAICEAETFRRARALNSRTSPLLHKRRLIFLLPFLAITGPCHVLGYAHMSMGMGYSTVLQLVCCYLLHVTADCVEILYLIMKHVAPAKLRHEPVAKLGWTPI